MGIAAMKEQAVRHGLLTWNEGVRGTRAEAASPISSLADRRAESRVISAAVLRKRTQILRGRAPGLNALCRIVQIFVFAQS